MTRAEEAKIKRIETVYQSFVAELEGLRQEQNQALKQALEQIDHERIQATLKSLHQL